MMITEAVRYHHENFDGTGHPSELVGKAIPVGARITMIADTVDVMTTGGSSSALLEAPPLNLLWSLSSQSPGDALPRRRTWLASKTSVPRI
jgi:hypothetical protein